MRRRRRRHHHRRHGHASTHLRSTAPGGDSGASTSGSQTRASSKASGATTSITSNSSNSSAWTSGLGPNAAATSALQQIVDQAGAGDFPSRRLISIYKAAAQRYHVQWEILAAVNAVETDYGRNVKTSPAGAVGFMQFMPATWRRYAVALGGRRKPNPYNPRDAVFAAANLLAANGGMRRIRRALYAYNHAGWYVDAVLWRARVIGDWASGRRRTDSTGYALPLAARYMRQLGRTDDGVEIETAPDGAPVYSIAPGVVTAVASDPSGFGPSYPVIRVTRGPLSGRYVYYGHVAESLVHVGEQVAAGQPIAVMGHTGDAASLGHGHIEIGFSDAAGDPLNHHGAVAATGAGAAMRRLLVELSAAFGIHNA